MRAIPSRQRGATIATESLRVDRDGAGVVTLTLDRPDVRNALDAALLAALRSEVEALATDDDAHVIVVTGAGDVFCAGADLGYMRAVREQGGDESGELSGVFRALHDLPKPLVCRMNGPALGGGVGLVACADVVVATEAAYVQFTEVRLGLVPAVISPYVVRKVGPAFARAVFLTGERVDAGRAREVGLLHDVVPAHALDEATATVVGHIGRGGPHALAVAKRLPDLAARPLDEVEGELARLITDLRSSDEAQEGMAAFLERRPPAWNT